MIKRYHKRFGKTPELRIERKVRLSLTFAVTSIFDCKVETAAKSTIRKFIVGFKPILLFRECIRQMYNKILMVQFEYRVQFQVNKRRLDQLAIIYNEIFMEYQETLARSKKKSD